MEGAAPEKVEDIKPAVEKTDTTVKKKKRNKKQKADGVKVEFVGNKDVEEQNEEIKEVPK
jgi:hypothetical protein